MKILVLTWEFPPRIVGGIARHVSELYPEIVKLGHEVHILTIEFGQAPSYEVVDGVNVHRVSVGVSHNFLHWVANMNESMGFYGGKLLSEHKDFDMIHAHDWLVSDAAIALKHLFKIPLIATIHATEYGRHNGLHNPTHYYIDNKEKRLAEDAWKVIVCTRYMQQEVTRALHAAWDKVHVIYNGIHLNRRSHRRDFDFWEFRRRFATDRERIVYYVGRLTYEKGVHVLLDAAPKVLWETGGTAKFVIVGSGNAEHLKQQAQYLGIWDKCYFTGFMPDADLIRFRCVADCSVFPSLYEPFGIVALESFAARVPVVVSNAGGLPEVVHHGETGIVTHVNDSSSLAWGILEVLKNPAYAHRMTNNAYRELSRRFCWSKLAEQTIAVYQQVCRERATIDW